MPERIRIMDSEPERSQGLRPLIVDNYHYKEHFKLLDSYADTSPGLEWDLRIDTNVVRVWEANALA
jgi:hypothetical protein